MHIIEQLRSDLKDAMRGKEEMRVLVIRNVLSAITNELVAKGKKPTDTLDEKELFAVLKRLVKQRKESAEQFTQGHRPELAEKEIKELAILETYLPQMASEDEIRAAVTAVLAETTDTSNQGMLVGMVMKRLNGTADGTVVKTILADILK